MVFFVDQSIAIVLQSQIMFKRPEWTNSPMSAGPKRRDEIVTYIERYCAGHGGQSPSLQEIAAAFGISKTAAEGHVQKLISEGRAVRHDGKLWLTQPPLFSPLDS